MEYFLSRKKNLKKKIVGIVGNHPKNPEMLSEKYFGHFMVFKFFTENHPITLKSYKIVYNHEPVDNA